MVSRALQVKQLLLHFLISGGALRGGRGSQRRVRSRSILYTIFESSSLARVSCFLMLLWVLKATVGLFGKSLERSRGFLDEVAGLRSNLVRRCVGRCGEYVVMKVRQSIPACGLLARVFCLSENVIPVMLLSMVSCLYPRFYPRLMQDTVMANHQVFEPKAGLYHYHFHERSGDKKVLTLGPAGLLES